jgi:hypothetical protein
VAVQAEVPEKNDQCWSDSSQKGSVSVKTRKFEKENKKKDEKKNFRRYFANGRHILKRVPQKNGKRERVNGRRRCAVTVALTCTALVWCVCQHIFSLLMKYL